MKVTVKEKKEVEGIDWNKVQLVIHGTITIEQ